MSAKQTFKWMWTEPAITIFGKRIAQLNPLRWSKTTCLDDVLADLESYRKSTCSNARSVLVQCSDGWERSYDTVADAIAAVGGKRRAKAKDWVLVRRIGENSRKWVYVPELIKSAQKNSQLNDISISEDRCSDYCDDMFNFVLDKEGLEVVFTAMNRSESTHSHPATRGKRSKSWDRVGLRSVVSEPGALKNMRKYMD